MNDSLTSTITEAGTLCRAFVIPSESRPEGSFDCPMTTLPRGYKTFFKLSSAEHEILNKFISYHSIKISRNSACLGSDKPRMLFFLFINDKMPTSVGILPL